MAGEIEELGGCGPGVAHNRGSGSIREKVPLGSCGSSLAE